MQPPQQNDIILLGSSARAATASAVAAGLQVTAVDVFGDADLRKKCQRYHPLSDAFPLAFLRSHEPSRLVPLGGCESWVSAIASLANYHRIAGATAEQWRLVTDVSVLREISRATGIRFPESYPAADGRPWLCHTGDRAAQRWLIKTPSRCGGLGVHWAENVSIAPDASWYQRWVEGTSIGASYLSSKNDVRMLGVCRGLKFRTGSHPAIYAGSCGPLHLRPEWTRKLIQLGHAAASRLELRGLFNVDLILHPTKGLYLLEINPRYSASMELLEPIDCDESMAKKATACRDSSLLAAHLRCFSEWPAGDSLPSASPERAAGSKQPVRCKRVVFTRHKIVFDMQMRRTIEAILDAHSAKWADIPVDGTTIFGERPLFSVFTEADSTATALRRAARLHQAIRQKLGQCS